MRFYEDIVLDSSIKDLDSIMKRGFSAIDYYAVCFCDRNSDLMEILSLNNILKDCYSEHDYGIVAVTRGKEAAFNFVNAMINTWLKEHDDLSGLKSYYNSRCR